MSSTKIEWTHPPGYRGVTLNPVVGCRPISAGCLNCYAATMAGQRLQHMPQSKAKYSGLTVLNNGRHAFNGVLRLDRDAALKPLSWREPRCIFACSMGDIFAGSDSDQKAGADEVPFEFLDLVFAVAALTPQHRYLLLTKRPDRAAEYLNGPRREMLICGAAQGIDDRHRTRLPGGWPLPNVAIGCSVSTQADADRDIPHLLECPAAMRFVSYEPALEQIDFGEWLRQSRTAHLGLSVEGALRNRSFDGYTDDNGRPLTRDQARAELEALRDRGVKMLPMGECDRFSSETGCPGHPNPRIDWLIVGGESGPNARPFDIEWAGSAVEQCMVAGVPCFVKQMGARPVCVEPIKFVDKHGSDLAEWPEDLRVRQWPEAFFAQGEAVAC